jgi:Arc/MetJ family transcription regulator
MVRTNIVLDDQLVEEAFRLSRAKTKRELIHEALREFVRVRGEPSLLELKGKIRFAKGYDHRKLRRER